MKRRSNLPFLQIPTHLVSRQPMFFDTPTLHIRIVLGQKKQQGKSGLGRQYFKSWLVLSMTLSNYIYQNYNMNLNKN